MNYKVKIHEESNINDNFRNWFYNSKVVDSDGKPLKVFHGTQRPDRVGSYFNPKRATSGPMAFFTSDPTIASGYASGKRDTSLENEESYATRYLVKPKGSRSNKNIIDYWYYLPSEKKEEIAKIAPYINRDEQDNIFIDEEGGINSLQNYQWELKQKRGNWLGVLVEIWLTSGALFDEEKEFMKVLSLLNLPDEVTYHDPHATYPGVYPVYLSIKNPLYTHEINQDTINALLHAGKRKRAKTATFGGNAWDKDSQDPKQWLQWLKDGEKYLWTSIPDWVTEALKALGYDGIIDTGNKSKSTDIEHSVYIPFYSKQIKSVYNRGTWSDSKNIHENNKK